MDFQTAVKTCFSKYADFNGRASRSEYWWFVLAEVIVLIVASLIHQFVYVIAALGFLLPALAVGARRLHDMGKSGWFQLVWLIPIIGWAVMVYWLVQPSVAGANEYGESAAQPGPTPVLPPGAV